MPWTVLSTGLPPVAGNVTAINRVTAVTFQNLLYVFCRGSDNNLYFNTSKEGVTWQAIWSQLPSISIPTDPAQDAAPSAAVLNGVLYVFGRKNGDVVGFTSTGDGKTWEKWQDIPGGTRAISGPSCTVFGEELIVVVRDLNNEIMVNRSTDGKVWQGWFEVEGGGKTLYAPSVVAYQGLGRLDIFVEGTDKQIYYNSSRDGLNFAPGWSYLGGATNTGTTAVTIDGEERVFVTGTTNAVYMQAFNGHVWNTTWGSSIRECGTTYQGIGATVLQDAIYIFICHPVPNSIWCVAGK